jgi:hypothetical protein
VSHGSSGSKREDEEAAPTLLLDIGGTCSTVHGIYIYAIASHGVSMHWARW